MGFYNEHILPWFTDKIMSAEYLSPERHAALREVAGDVLEIGFGTGLNLPHYPDTVRSLTALDPSKGMAKRARRRIRESSLKVQLREHEAEKLPFEDASFDAVVSTWTLCTIPDTTKAMDEVVRVLKRGGKFFFVEHGLAKDARVRRWQNLLTPFQKRYAGGCRLNRDIEGIVRRSGLRISTLDRYYLPKNPKIFGSTYRGVAVRDG